jgi:uncharacterized protein YwqG
MHWQCNRNRVAILLLLALQAAGCSQDAPVPGMEQLPPQLAPFARKIADSKLPHVNATPIVGKTTLWESKLRGVPYYPKARAWPTDPQGKPLVLLVQINFAEIPPLEGYPTKGILQLYISADYDPEKQMWGMRNDFTHATQREQLTDQRYFRAICFPNVSRDVELLITEAPKVDFNEEYGFPAVDEARLQFTLGSSYVRPEDYRFRRVFGKDRSEFFDDGVLGPSPIEEAYEKFMDGEMYHARIGGYSSVVQMDPRLEFPDDDWILLFSLNYYGDIGIGNFYIQPADLAKRDFSKVMYYFDFD